MFSYFCLNGHQFLFQAFDYFLEFKKNTRLPLFACLVISLQELFLKKTLIDVGSYLPLWLKLNSLLLVHSV